MRIQVLSDIHLEFAPFQSSDVKADVIIFAGDLHTGTNGIKWILDTIKDRPVVYVLGNHEFYGQTLPKLIAKIKAIAHGTNVYVLENDHFKLGDVIFLGATLWTDFQICGDLVLAEVAAQTGMTDFRRIRTLPSYRRFRPRDARVLHAESLEWLRQQTIGHGKQKVVVVTHHAPSPQSIPTRFRGDPLNPAFASNLEPFISEYEPTMWIHGHIHQRADYVVGNTRVIANPRGYPSEPYTGFDPELVVDI